MYNTGDVSYRRVGNSNKWIVEQVLDGSFSIPDGSFEEMIAHLEKEMKYYKEEYLSGPCETSCDSIVPKYKESTTSFSRRPKFKAEFKSIHTDKKMAGDSDYGGYYLVIGVRDPIPEELEILIEQDKRSKATAEDRDRKELARLKAMFETSKGES